MNTRKIFFVLLCLLISLSLVAKSPKYIFLFIGDGMSYPQFQTAADYLGALEDNDDEQALPSKSFSQRKGAVLDGPKKLNFMNFDFVGSAVTYDSCSFAPDSASTATSIASGKKTYSGMLNMDETGKVPYETIAEKLHKQKNYKIGIVTSVNINHATPAAFYAHQSSRSNYYNIGVELTQSGFEYFAGGAFIKPEGYGKGKENLYQLAEKAGYKIAKTQKETKKITASDKKVILIDEHLADSNTLAYNIDRKKNYWSLADYVKKGIDVIYNKTGFFMMCEAGKIDWACHANDAGSIVHDVLALTDAVQVAIDFAEKHPNETLILVTGDHETGGLSIGFAGTNYDTYLDTLANQKISYAKFDEEYVANYKKNNVSFENAMKDVETLFGLKISDDKKDRLTLTEYEIQRLKNAYELALSKYNISKYSQEQQVLYGTYNPFSVTITHILNNKAGLNFGSYSHSGLPVAVFAKGVGAKDFSGYYDNTEIFKKLASLLMVK